VVAYGRLKTKENFKLSVLKVVAFSYERWSLTRGSKYSDLAWKVFGILKNWSLRKGGRLREMVATRGSTVGYSVKDISVADLEEGHGGPASPLSYFG